jgi:uncharacterized protein YbaR (Trm112 family)
MNSIEDKNAESDLLAPAFIALLCCPLCPERPRLRLAEDRKHLLCAHGKHTFPIDPEFGFPDLRPPGEREVAPAAKE